MNLFRHFFPSPINPMEHKCLWMVGDRIEVYYKHWSSTTNGRLVEINSKGIVVQVGGHRIHFKVFEPLECNLSAVRGGRELNFAPVAGINNVTALSDNTRRPALIILPVPRALDIN